MGPTYWSVVPWKNQASAVACFIHGIMFYCWLFHIPNLLPISVMNLIAFSNVLFVYVNPWSTMNIFSLLSKIHTYTIAHSYVSPYLNASVKNRHIDFYIVHMYKIFMCTFNIMFIFRLQFWYICWKRKTMGKFMLQHEFWIFLLNISMARAYSHVFHIPLIIKNCKQKVNRHVSNNNTPLLLARRSATRLETYPNA